MNPPPLNPLRQDTASAITLSLSAFVWGFFSFVPLLGIAPAVYVYLCWRRVRYQLRPEWNPAQPYLLTAIILASISLAIHTLLVLGVVQALTC